MSYSPDQRRIILDVARAAIRSSLAGQEPSDLPVTDPDLMRPAGCFVSLHNQKTHRLRGCIGHIHGQTPLLECVREMAREVLRDPRFCSCPVSPGELEELEIEVTVLSPLQPAAHALAFDLLNDGIYLRYGGRTGCFLPQVARQTGWSREQLLARLCSEKMDLPADTWKKPEAKLQTFTAEIIGPQAFGG